MKNDEETKDKATEETPEKKEPVSTLTETPAEETPKEEKPAPEIPSVDEVLQEPDREKGRLTEILLILIIILLGATSVYFYQANERLTESYNNLSKGVESNIGTLTALSEDIQELKSEKDSSKETLAMIQQDVRGLLKTVEPLEKVQQDVSDLMTTVEPFERVQQDVDGLLKTSNTIKDRIYNISEGQRENLREINRIVNRVNTAEKDTSINQLKEALVIVNGINRSGTSSRVRAVSEKLESDIEMLITDIATDGKVPAKPPVKKKPKKVVKPTKPPVTKAPAKTAPAKKAPAAKKPAAQPKNAGVVGTIDLKEATVSAKKVPAAKPKPATVKTEAPVQKQSLPLEKK